jgi:hypothetical protein
MTLRTSAVVGASGVVRWSRRVSGVMAGKMGGLKAVMSAGQHGRTYR